MSPLLMTPVEFIAAVGPAARASMATTRIPASFTVAQAALESSWGKSQLAVQARNLFGVKASAGWAGDILTMDTREFIKGRWVVVPARWRKYPDWLACIDDHAQFLLKNPRYKPAFACHEAESFVRAVAAAGYATDPQYANKIIAVIRGRNLTALDKQ
ncbi:MULTISPECIES: glycoside hydrolase family 73 protein [unclassified Duganella]|uniref:glycoside hydrolase family 73 protein n=1 Tax=unclassified Duganella TaxID=2636909 RepID=UPI001E37A68D|nr:MULTISPECIES: glycoside hydrolase family 73 protein [unclassified Duganella]